MYLTNIIFSSEPIDDTILEEIDCLLHSLFHSGCIIDLRNHAYKNGNEIIFQCRLPEKNSLSQISNYKWSKVLQSKKVTIQVEILGEDIDNFDVCNCANSDSFILMGNPIIPLICGNCHNYVPLYRIPYTYENNYQNINIWNHENQAWFELEFISAEEAFAHFQLGEFSSSHNQTGSNLRSIIEQKTNTKCYYYLEELRFIENVHEKKCPNCGGHWYQENKFLDKYDFKCDSCNLLSNISPYS